MKCPKCGSVELKLENKSQLPLMEAPQVALKCAKCSHWIKWCPKEERHRYIEPTTTEKLLWLIKNIPLDCDTQNIAFAFGWKEEVFGGDIESQIKQAYDWAKQEVTE